MQPKPASVTAAIALHSVLVLLFVVGLLKYAAGMTLAGFSVAGLILVVYVPGFVGILKRYRWARVYNAFILSFWGGLSALSSALSGAKQQSWLWAGWGMFILILTAWIGASFIGNQGVKNYFASDHVKSGNQEGM